MRRQDRKKKTKKANGEPRKRHEHSAGFLSKLKSKQDRFLAALRQTNGRELAACRVSGVSVDSVLDWRELYPDFAKRYDRELGLIVPMAARDEAIRRGVEGYAGRPMVARFYDKKLKKVVAQLLPIREYSDSMLGRVLSAHDKRFRPGDLAAGETGDGKIIVEIRNFAPPNKSAA